MLTLKNLKSPKGAHRNTKRIGRGQGSGQGTQAGKGHKGQMARKSGHVRLGYEGGTMPLFMRLPKRGFNNHNFATEYAVVTLGQIAGKFDKGEVTKAALIEAGLIKGANKSLPVKVLCKGEYKKALTFVDVDKFSQTAAELIAKCGGSIKNK